MNHTPAPWKYQRDLYNTPYEELGFGIYSEATGLRLAEITPALHNCDGHRMENQEPTARLIAAAPELLDALERLFEHTAMVHNRWGESSNTEEADSAIRDARAAIKKARGG